MTALTLVAAAMVVALFHATMNHLLDPDTHPVRRRHMNLFHDRVDFFGWPWQVAWWRAWLSDWEGRFWRALILSGYYVVPEDEWYRGGYWQRHRRRWGMELGRPCPRPLYPCFWCACTSSWKRAMTYWWRGYP